VLRNFLTSPEIVTAMAFSGSLSFNPVTDSLPGADGTHFRFSPPSAAELPSRGFTPGDVSFVPSPSPTPDASVAIAIDPNSTRLEVLEPFAPNVPADADPTTFELTDLRCLLRVRGKVRAARPRPPPGLQPGAQCTTDDISAAGPWLKYKGACPVCPCVGNQ
jgi:homoaconitase